MGTRAEQMAELQAQMDALAAEEEGDDDYEIEIYSPEGHGARVPYRKGKGFLATHFGIDADTMPKPSDDKVSGKSAKGSKREDDKDNAASSGEPGLRLFRQGRQAPGDKAS